MMDAAAIREIVDQYAKHGWVLRRVLLSAALSGHIKPSDFGADAVIEDHKHDCLWFSRRSKPDCEAWELRRLSGTPFALVAVVNDEDGDDVRDEILKETELRMFEADIRNDRSH